MGPELFTYLDYRKYLLDYYQSKKQENASYSFTIMAQKAGFRNRGFLHNVMNGKKNLSKSSVFKLSQALKHSKSEAEYFENLVFFNQSNDLTQRNHYFSLMNSIRSRIEGAAHIQKVRLDQYEYYANWYHSAVRSLIDLYPFKGNYKWLAQKVFPTITPKQARQSVKLLVRLGLIKKKTDGYFEVPDKHISTGNELLDLAALNFHRECTRLAAESIETLPKDNRNITGLTMGISQNAYLRICEEANDFRQRITDIVEADDGCDRVYQMNIHIFPFSKPEKTKERNS